MRKCASVELCLVKSNNVLQVPAAYTALWRIVMTERYRNCNLNELFSTNVRLSRAGASIPLTPWSKVPPPLPLPPPLPPPLPLPLPSLPLPSPPLRSRPPLVRLGGLGERFSSPSGSGRSPAAKQYLVNFRLVATIFRSFSGNETSNYDRHVGCLFNN